MKKYGHLNVWFHLIMYHNRDDHIEVRVKVKNYLRSVTEPWFSDSDESETGKIWKSKRTKYHINEKKQFTKYYIRRFTVSNVRFCRYWSEVLLKDDDTKSI